MRRETVVKEYNFYVGLDVHSESVSVAVAEKGRGEVRFIGTLPNDPVVIIKALRKLGHLGSVKACYRRGPGRAATDCTGRSSKPAWIAT